MLQLNGFQEQYKAFFVAFPGGESGCKALSDGGYQQHMSMSRISRDLRLARRKCVSCCSAEKGNWPFWPFSIG